MDAEGCAGVLDDVAGGRGEGEKESIGLQGRRAPNFEGSLLDLLNRRCSDMYYY